MAYYCQIFVNFKIFFLRNTTACSTQPSTSNILNINIMYWGVYSEFLKCNICFNDQYQNISSVIMIF